MKPSSPPISTVLLVEDDVILRLGLGDYLRACGYRVIEAVDAREAKLVLQKGPPVDILLADAQADGNGAGFALSGWIRRNRPQIQVVLTGGLASKTEAAAKLCETRRTAPYPVGELRQRIEGMRARHRRASAAKSQSAPRGPGKRTAR